MKKNKILLVFPSTGPDFLEPPFGLISLGTTLKEAGFDVSIIDCRTESLRDNLKRRSTLLDILFVGITAMTGPQIGHALKVSKILREFSVGPILWGGIHATILPEETIADPHVDYVLRGYADRSVVDFANALISDRKDLEAIPGILFKRDGKIVQNKELPYVKLLDLKIPDWKLINLDNYRNKIFTGLESIYLFSSRGCPHSCTFCYGLSFHGKKWQGRSAEQVIDELEYLATITNFECVFFHDDDFSASEVRIKKIVSYLKEKNKKYVISANATDIDEPLIALLSETGCVRLDISIESGSDKILSLYNKGFTVVEVKNLLQIADKYKLPINIAFIIGHPDETREDVEMTLDLVDLIRKNYPRNNILDLKILTPYPGTPIYDDALKKGLQPPASLSDWSEYYWNTIGPWRKESKYLIDLSYWSLFFLRYNHLMHYPFPINLAIKTMHLISKFRWKHRFFKFPIETRLTHVAFIIFNRYLRKS